MEGIPHRCRTGAAPVPHRCRRRSEANPHGYLQTARKKAKKIWVFFPVFFWGGGVFVLLGVFLCVFGGAFARRRRAAHPPAFRTRSALCSTLVPNFLCTCAALWADLRRGVLWAGLVTWRRFTVVAPAGAVGVGDPLAAERLALLRCRPRLLAVPVRVQQFVLASFWRRAGPLRPTQWEGGRGGGGCLSIGAGRAESGSRRLYTRKGDGGLGLAVGDGA